MITIVTCPACGSADTVIKAELSAERHIWFTAFSQVKYDGLLESWLEEIPPVILGCVHCGHCWYRHQPEPEQLGQMYAVGRSLTPGVQASRVPSAGMIAEMNRLHHLVGRRGDAPTLLDYGSGFGHWARAAVQAGFAVTAFEPCMVRGSEEQVPFELTHDLVSIQGRNFAVIQLEQVLEHVPDPLTTLKQIKAFCTPTTVVRITVPNILRAPEGKKIWALWPFDGKRPHLLAPFEHLHGFTPQSLNCLLARAGFKPTCRIRLWKMYPMMQTRSLVEQLFPSLGSTLRIVSLV
jgi:hypothetical protein